MKIRAAALLTLATFATLSGASSAQAQISNPVKFTIFGGAALPVGDTKDAVKTGYTVGGALDFRVPLSPLGIRGEVVYSGLDAKGLDGSGFNADVSDFGANINLVGWLPTLPGAPMQAYFTGGPSFSHLKVSASGNGLSESAAENHWGFNLGAGLQFSLGGLGTRLDARYRRISMGDGDNFSIIPITFGITF
jgi:opacity protein-like surface antigen